MLNLSSQWKATTIHIQGQTIVAKKTKHLLDADAEETENS